MILKRLGWFGDRSLCVCTGPLSQQTYHSHLFIYSMKTDKLLSAVSVLSAEDPAEHKTGKVPKLNGAHALVVETDRWVSDIFFFKTENAMCYKTSREWRRGTESRTAVQPGQLLYPMRPAFSLIQWQRWQLLQGPPKLVPGLSLWVSVSDNPLDPL